MSNSLNKSIKKTQDAIGLIEKELINVNSQVLKLSESAKKVSSSFSSFSTPTQVKKGLEEIQKQSKKLEETTKKQRLAEIKLAKAREKAFDNYDKQVKREELARERLLKKQEKEAEAIRKAAKLSKRLSEAMSVASRKRNELARIIQNLNVKRELGIKLSDKEQKELKQSTAQFKKYDNAVKKAKNSVNRFQENVGNYPKALGAASKAIRTMASALGLVGGAFLAIGAIKDAFKRIREFDKSMQNLSGVLRVSRKDIKDLEKQIINVAGSSVRTSNEVANLAESLITLGKSKDEVKELLKPVTDLSLGLDASSDEAGEFLVSMLNTFGASTDSAAKYADTIATIRTSTSLDFQRMRDSFQYIAPIAKILNKDLADVGALIGILTDNGIKAESAGRLLSTGMQRLAKEGKTLEQALEEINVAQSKGVKETELLVIATKLFGVQAAKIGITLANNTDKIDKNAQAIRDNSGALDDLVKEQLKSVDAKLKVLDSTWEELILTIENGNGSIAKSFKNFIGLLTIGIKKTTELETAQTKLNKIGVESNGWRDFFNLVLPGLDFLPDSYKKAEKAQLEFNRANKELSVLSVDVLKARKELLVTAFNSKELTEKESKTYLAQIRVLEQSIKKKKQERINIVATAKELGFAGQAYSSTGKLISNFYENAEQASTRELKLFIANNKKKIESSKELEKEREKEGKRKEISLRTAEEITKKETEAAKEILKTVKDSFKNESSFELPKIDQEQLEAFSREINEKVSEDLKIQIAKDDIKEGLDDLAGTIDEFTGVSGDKFLDFFDKITDKGRDSFEGLADIAASSFSLAGDVSNLFFQGKIDGYQDDIDANNEYYANLLDNETLSSEERDRLEKDRKVKEDKIKKEQAKERKKQFEVNKLFRIGEIIADTAQAIIKTGASLGYPAAIPFQIQAGVLGAAQLAIVAAQSPPRFAEGGIMKEDGKMIINDHKSGRLEVVERNGEFLMTTKKNVEVDGKKGDIIHKDANDVLSNISDKEMINNLEKNTMIATLIGNVSNSNKLEKVRFDNLQKEHTDRIVAAITRKKTNFNIHNNTKLNGLNYLRALNEDF